jgi:hypothetical protein
MATYYQLSDSPRTWAANNAAELINNAVLGQAASPANDITAFMVQRPARPAGTPIRVHSPENWLEDDLKLGAITIYYPPGSDGVKDEWKECRATIGRFDGLLVDLRKTGFGFVTAIVSGPTFLFAYTRQSRLRAASLRSIQS